MATFQIRNDNWVFYYLYFDRSPDLHFAYMIWMDGALFLNWFFHLRIRKILTKCLTMKLFYLVMTAAKPPKTLELEKIEKRLFHLAAWFLKYCLKICGNVFFSRAHQDIGLCVPILQSQCYHTKGLESNFSLPRGNTLIGRSFFPIPNCWINTFKKSFILPY